MAAKAVLSFKLSKKNDSRYVLVDTETGEILDDADGRGYKTAQKAHIGFSYKNQRPEQKKERQRKRVEKEKEIQKWMAEHKEFAECLDEDSFRIYKGSDPDLVIDEKYVQKWLDEAGYQDLPFSAKELYRMWANGKL